jgi:hypothetical protein
MAKKLLASKVLLPSRILEDSTLRKNLPDYFVEASDLWSQVVRDIEHHLTELREDGGNVEGFLDDINLDYEFDRCDGIFKKSCWSWAPSGKIVSFGETDRMGQHFFGAMYTCEEYEWPQHEGYPYKPFFQLSLDEASEVAGVYVGSGLLQLFEGPILKFTMDWYLLRHIPRGKISEDQLTPVPLLNEEQSRQIKETYSCGVEDIMGGDLQFLEASYRCIDVEGYTDKRFSMPYDVTAIDELHWALKSLGIESLKTAVVNLVKISECLGKLRYEIGKNKYSDMALFGFAEPIQMGAWEMPDPLLNIGGCRNLIDGWRDDSKFDIFLEGSGQVYLKIDSNEEPSYEFYGDCS